MNTLDRRSFMAASAALAASAVAPVTLASASGRARSRLSVGVIGCGGRGTGAAVNILEASPDTQIVAVADAFPDRLAGCVSELAKLEPALASRCVIAEDRRFVGLGAYKELLATKPDIVILATPPGFRPAHFAAAVDAGCHVFMEKPVAVDPVGARLVIDAAARATEKKLNVVTGTQRRHETCYLEAIKRINDGALGEVTSATVYWNQGSLWMNRRQEGWSDMEWQLRNWLYFTWLSGDHIVEQHVHNIDAGVWAINAGLPVRCTGMGGREVRRSPEYGHVFDHFAVEYEYADGRSLTSYCRQIDGCASRVEEVIRGSHGVAVLGSGRAEIRGKNAWKWQGGQENPYVTEHKALIAGIAGGQYINEARRIAESTLLAIMGRMSAYTGKVVSWEHAMKSTLDLTPAKLELGPMPAGEVAVPGKTPLI